MYILPLSHVDWEYQSIWVVATSYGYFISKNRHQTPNHENWKKLTLEKS